MDAGGATDSKHSATDEQTSKEDDGGAGDGPGFMPLRVRFAPPTCPGEDEDEDPVPVAHRTVLYATPTQLVVVVPAGNPTGCPTSRVFRVPEQPGAECVHVCDTPLAPACRQKAAEALSVIPGSAAPLQPSPSPASLQRVHDGVACDICNVCPIRGPRYKDADAFDYDLCSSCYAAGQGTMSHRFSLIEEPRTTGTLLPTRADSAGAMPQHLRLRGSVPSAVCYDATQDRLWCYFSSSHLVQQWHNCGSIFHEPAFPELATAGNASSAAAAVRDLATFVLFHLGRVSRVASINPLAVHPVQRGQHRASGSAGVDTSVIPVPAGIAAEAVDGSPLAVYRHAATGRLSMSVTPLRPVAGYLLAELSVRAAPSDDAETLGTLPPGASVEVAERRGDWLRLTTFTYDETPPPAGPSDAGGMAPLDLDAGGDHDRTLSYIMQQMAARAHGRPTEPQKRKPTRKTTASAWILQRPAATAPYAVVSASDQNDPAAGMPADVGAASSSYTPGMAFGSGFDTWSGRPDDLLGWRIAVLWAGNNYFEGTVTDARGVTTHVEYDDGDKRWYNLADKTFKLVKPPQPKPGETR